MKKTRCKYKRKYNICNILLYLIIVKMSLYNTKESFLNYLFDYTKLYGDRIHNIKQFGNRFCPEHGNSCMLKIGNAFK